MTPRVTVLLAVHDGEPYVRQAVESILAQSFGDFEFLIIDDASTDSTPETIAALVEIAEAEGAAPIAHTLPEENASNRALRRNGFVYAGEVDDPEDGLIWRWVKDISA